MNVRRQLLAVLIGIVAFGCSEPPDKEHHQAEGALTAARAAEAAVYAPDELRAAETAFSGSGAAVEQHDYRLALSLALEARDSAYEAVKRAGDEKAAARSEAERLVVELETLVDRASARLGGATPPRPAGAAAARLRAAVRTASTALQEARSNIGVQKYRDAAARVRPEVDALTASLASSSSAPARAPR